MYYKQRNLSGKHGKLLHIASPLTTFYMMAIYLNTINIFMHLNTFSSKSHYISIDILNGKACNKKKKDFHAGLCIDIICSQSRFKEFVRVDRVLFFKT